MNIVKYLEESGLLIKDTSETIENESKEQKGGFVNMFLGILGASLLENTLTGKKLRAINWGQGGIRANDGVISGGEGTIREGQNF